MGANIVILLWPWDYWHAFRVYCETAANGQWLREHQKLYTVHAGEGGGGVDGYVVCYKSYFVQED